ncbi:MAG: hypothetical protein KJ900_07105 [Proteobacteria bacterium]|nr:transposase [Desulfocapsa sp.]MBU3946344.1 hypothetical protein [Pseudomonadota bacterium]MCG2742751.1 hypothetical protein [Desulfobacteraceae bacterium]MBU3984401.1 hypothetical protein [Pseudomonadota bacterium]MBU4030223.1 hypothetical protein [Pseudomonadota bacterium]
MAVSSMYAATWLPCNWPGEKRYSPVWCSCFNRQRGKPGTSGDQYDAEAVNALPEIREGVFLCGKWQWVRYRSAVCLARLMKERKVRAIWMQVEDENGALSKQRLNPSTLSDLLPQQIFVYYGRRWSIEDLFNQMKNRWGWKDAWQQSRLVLHRWTQILSIAYASLLLTESPAWSKVIVSAKNHQTNHEKQFLGRTTVPGMIMFLQGATGSLGSIFC